MNMCRHQSCGPPLFYLRPPMINQTLSHAHFPKHQPPTLAFPKKKKNRPNITHPWIEILKKSVPSKTIKTKGHGSRYLDDLTEKKFCTYVGPIQILKIRHLPHDWCGQTWAPQRSSHRGSMRGIRTRAQLMYTTEWVQDLLFPIELHLLSHLDSSIEFGFLKGALRKSTFGT